MLGASNEGGSLSSFHTLPCPGSPEHEWRLGLKPYLGDAPEGPAGSWDSPALCSCTEDSTMHMLFCCSNNRISVVGARSLGLSLRVNQTLRILIVSARLMERPQQTCLRLSTQMLPLSHEPTPVGAGNTGSRAQMGEGASCIPLLPRLPLATHSPISSLVHALLQTPPRSILPSQWHHHISHLSFLLLSPPECCSADDDGGTLASPSSSPLLFLWPC